MNVALGVGLGVGLGAGVAQGPPNAAQERGRRLAQAYCGQCHALGEGPSPARDAPPFPQLHRRYPPGGGLADLLGEGMIAPAVPQEEGAPKRHPRMPQVRLDEDQVSDLAAFLRAAQASGDASPQRD
jgi:mono/diheme cytochrome c family protein